VRRRGGLLDHGAVGSEVAAQHHGAPFRMQRPIERQDDVGLVDARGLYLTPRRLEDQYR
jgi:hypothetical protein